MKFSSAINSAKVELVDNAPKEPRSAGQNTE